ncbi:hypothetical protein CONPUDRAFT_105602 [Coniophora puteana RWD-64-598 SS2]|uniref:F-box domain-containing protein n=1 Tax=Coniophora puteana (strain RWD-64-598) TaxID=741705 RepID=A0A5M3MN03_CONPW|nr:uncharacterized protein CONPUDRAFT_105602 [Coniophora puteana RWD-64-598 SS2]EIW80558.1 hypothetical protein CONPUDRAFT_105602 [Coniophora puteana RWD-64-598 SS2]
MFSPENVPLDLLSPILENLERKDLNIAALVNWTFNRASTPLLYRKLDSRIINNVLFHPATTLLKRPELAQYVRNITETGSVQKMEAYYPTIRRDTLAALRLCTNLYRLTWVDDTETPDENFYPFIDVIRALPVRSLAVRTQYDMGPEVWRELENVDGIEVLSVWTLEGPPRALQGWADTLGKTLTHLELGRCAGVPPTILISVFMKMPMLQDLRLKGAPSAAIPAIVACLPSLVALDTEYLSPGIYRSPLTPLPRLKRLTVRTGSLDVLGPQSLWPWTNALIPHQGTLETFTLSSFAVHGQMPVNPAFMNRLIEKHGSSLRDFNVGMTQLTLDMVHSLCLKCRELRALVCSVASPDVESIERATVNAPRLQELRLHVQWMPDGNKADSHTDYHNNWPVPLPRPHFGLGHFTENQARNFMLRPDSQLRAVGMGDNVYTGRWVLRDEGQHLGTHVDRFGGGSGQVFEVTRNLSMSVL